MDEILAALEAIESPGSFSTEKTAKADNFEIKLNKIGTLEFPISESQINALIALAQPAKFGWKDQTILDENVRKVWEISKSKLRIGKKQWDKKFAPLLDEIKNELGLPKKSKLVAELHNMLIYEPGHFFKPHQDSEKTDGMVASLVIILPTTHEGGELIIDHRGIKKIHKFKPSKIARMACIAFYADCYHEVKEVTSGYRVSLTYNLILEKYQGQLETLYERDVSSKLTQAVTHYFYPKTVNANRRTPLKMVYLLDHQYTQHSLSWDSLKNADRTRMDALLKIADDLNLDAHLALADMKETWDCEFDYEEYRYRKKNRFHEEEEEEAIPSYITDTDTTLKYWLNREGADAGYQEFSPDHREVCWTGANNHFEPYASEYEGWMGNYGNTLDRWYHRAAIILWRKDDYYPVLFEMDQESFINEIFLLMKSETKRVKLQEMLRHAAPYWQAYAKNHKDEASVLDTMQLALFLNDASISKSLLTAYEMSCFNTRTVDLWATLIKNYGIPWCLDILEAIARKEKAQAIPDFSSLLSTVLQKIESPNLTHWLLTHQFNTLKAIHKNDTHNRFNLRRNEDRRVHEMSDFMMAVINSGNKDSHANVLDYLVDNTTLYPPVLLVELLVKCVSCLKAPNLNSWSYGSFFEYLYEHLTTAYQSGLREKEDWSIKEKSKCSCVKCQVLTDFLKQSKEREKIWPLTQSERFHIESEVKALDVPVNCRTEQTGRPYKLILTKQDNLYYEAEQRYIAIEKAILQLNNLRPLLKPTVDNEESGTAR